MLFNRNLMIFEILQPPAAFSGLSMRPECVGGRGSAPNPAGGVYSLQLTVLPDALVGGEGAAARCPLPKNSSPAVGLNLPPLRNSFHRHCNVIYFDVTEKRKRLYTIIIIVALYEKFGRCSERNPRISVIFNDPTLI